MNLSLNNFDLALQSHGLPLVRTAPRVLQINVGKRCNQTCVHCHVNAGPARREMMTRETADRILEWLFQTQIPTVDITGGAPELNPNFRYLVERIKNDGPKSNGLSRHVMDRCNLTVLWEPGQQELGEFLAAHEVEIVASLPCYSVENVDAQRGDGVFDKSIRALQYLNTLGYGCKPHLPLNLVYNPNGAFLPGPQAALEAAYKSELREAFGIEFNNLLALANVPISRYAQWLAREGVTEQYGQLLLDNFNPHAVEGLMCRETISVGWRGEVYDCDFNQMLNMQWRSGSNPLYLWDIAPQQIEGRAVLTGDHCFACTAGAGSSCGGATTVAVS
jgi:radical SAM/Cys-rich protein